MRNIRVEIIYPLPNKQEIITLELSEGSTVEDAINASELLSHYPELNLATIQTGIFSKKVPLSHLLSDGDRVEIYRELLIDPKTARRKRL